MPRILDSVSVKLFLNQLARGEHGSGFLSLHRLAVHRPEPPQPDQLGDTAGVLAVGLHRHDLERIAHVARLEKLDRKSRLLHPRIEPLRCRSRFEADPCEFYSEGTEPGDQRLRLTRDLPFPDDFAAAIDRADG
jgi:hypothetical protein